MEGPRVVPIVLIPRFTTFAGANVEFRTHAIAVTEFESIEVFVWRGDLASGAWSVTFAVEEPMDQEHPKYVCAPCSNCKGQIRDIIKYYDAWEKAGIYYGGLVELMVNAMVDVEPGFIDWEWH